MIIGIRSDDEPDSTWLDDVAPETRDVLQPVFDRLDELAELPPGWSTPDVPQISPTALDTARQLMLAAVEEHGAEDLNESAIDVNPTIEGGVEIGWQGPAGELELTIQPDGTLSYMLMQDHGLDRRFEEADLDSPTAAVSQISRVLM
jgi:hypothetical protein